MKLTTFRSQILNVPEDEPLAGVVEKEGVVGPIVILTLGTGGTPAVDKGEMLLGDKPGFALAFDQRAVARYAA